MVNGLLDVMDVVVVVSDLIKVVTRAAVIAETKRKGISKKTSTHKQRHMGTSARLCKTIGH